LIDGDERRAWICLASVSGVGGETVGLLVGRYGSASAVLRAAAAGELRRWSRRRWREEGQRALHATVVAEIEHAAARPDRLLQRIGELGLWTLTPLDTGYPPRLRDLDPPPAVINGWGDPSVLLRPRSVALVGTRRPTPGGRLLAGRIAARLVECRAVVVSGLAVGIDGAGHSATVEREGQTVGVIGAGHGSPGPRAHAALRDRILARGGAIISEHHPDVTATRGTYPRRNRIIAALGDATLVVEAPHRSGALITANRALELGRPVFVAPGRIGDWSMAGSLALLRDTPARPLVGLDEMTDDLGYFTLEDAVQAGGHPAIATATSAEAALTLLGETERLVARRLCRGPAGLDTLVADTGLPPAAVAGAVTLLMMRGWLQAVGPSYLPAGPLLR
jgi:DNA processing protein